MVLVFGLYTNAGNATASPLLRSAQEYWPHRSAPPIPPADIVIVLSDLHTICGTRCGQFGIHTLEGEGEALNKKNKWCSVCIIISCTLI